MALIKRKPKIEVESVKVISEGVSDEVREIMSDARDEILDLREEVEVLSEDAFDLAVEAFIMHETSTLVDGERYANILREMELHSKSHILSVLDVLIRADAEK
jgi:hypothetical protein